MAHADPRYADVNARSYPPLTRVQSYVFAHQLLAKLGAPSLCAVQGIEDATGRPMFPARRVLMNIFSQYTGGSKRLGRTCWASTRPTTGHDKGWGRLIHDVSHMLQQYRHPGERPHGGSHSGIEKEVADCVDRNNMLERSQPKARDRDAERLLLLEHKRALVERWAAKERRAVNAQRKLLRQITALKRRIGDMSL